MPPGPEKGVQWNEVTWYSKILAIILFVILVCGAFYFGIWYQTQKESLAASVTTQNSSGAYKQAFYGEIPSTWNTYFALELSNVEHPAQTLQDLNTPATLVYSFSPDGVIFDPTGSSTFERVDFYFVSTSVAESLLNKASQAGGQITSETVGGYTSEVISYPNGEQDFLIGYPSGSFYAPNFLLMRKWSTGSPVFEAGFEHYLRTAQFQSEG
jgi:hypothetical protein